MDTYQELETFGEDSPAPFPSAMGTKQADETHARSAELVSLLRQDIIGSNAPFHGPYGDKPTLYCDWTASGRCLKSIEGFVQSEILPLYGNTHTTTSITGHQSTSYRDEARKLVAQAVNARIMGRASEDVVLFVGNGTTGAIAKLIISLGLKLPLPFKCDPDIDQPVVFVSSYEHHSNLVSWRETVAEVVVVAYHPLTGVSILDLESKLQLYSRRKCKIGSFSAASNVTGVLTDVKKVSITMHKAQGLVFFDYATAAPYVKIEMNPSDNSEDCRHAYKDAIFFSGHKFIGGPGTSGVLVVKSRILPPRTGPPSEPGGGTVFYVADSHQRYLSNRIEREEAGTPNLIADVKLGLVMHLHASIGREWIEKEELRVSESVYVQLSSLSRVVLLGRPSEFSNGKHLPIFSFLIRFGERFLHYNFVCALLNDLFGIQSRGGCSCAGPLSQIILGITASVNQDIELLLLDKNEVYRPGYSRLSFPFFMSDSEIQFVVASIEFVSLYGWKFLAQYKHNPKTGEFAHVTRMTKFPERKWLSHFNVAQTLSPPDTVAAAVGLTFGDSDYVGLFSDAKKELLKAEASKDLQHRMLQMPEVDKGSGDAEEQLRWFALLKDVNKISALELLPLRCPFDPSFFPILSLSSSAHESNFKCDGELETAYARKRAGKLIYHSANAPIDRSPRYLLDNWRADGQNHVLQHCKGSSGPQPEEGKMGTEDQVCALKQAEREKFSRLKEDATMATDLTLGNEYFEFDVVQPPPKMLKLVRQAIHEWALIQDGDRLLLGYFSYQYNLPLE